MKKNFRIRVSDNDFYINDIDSIEVSPQGVLTLKMSRVEDLAAEYLYGSANAPKICAQIVIDNVQSIVEHIVPKGEFPPSFIPDPMTPYI